MNNKVLMVGFIALIAGTVLGYSIPEDDRFSMYRGGMMSERNIDQHFIEQMIPHHEGAIEMANIALERSKRADVLSLARGIIEVQEREIESMRGWYLEWFGRAVAEGTHQMGMMGFGGDEDMLRSIPAGNFDQEFLSQMIIHHEMAIMMAQMLEAGTERDEMRTLADQIITSQSREITMMQSWLNTL